MITKLQKEYLEKRLTELINEKIDNFKKENFSKPVTRGDLYNFIKSGKIKLKPLSEISGADCELEIRYDKIEYLFDLSSIVRINKENSEKIGAYKAKLKEESMRIMDKVMFEGLGIKRAIEELTTLEEN